MLGPIWWREGWCSSVDSKEKATDGKSETTNQDVVRLLYTADAADEGSSVDRDGH